MASLKCGIVGLPNVGKSTLFNALLKKQQAFAANFPFATIEPNIGVVPVPDARLNILAKAIKESEGLGQLPPEVPATVEFVDIAGLIAGAHKGEGLGNKFLSHIREVDAVLHVVRNFQDENVIREGSTDPKSDLEIIETELLMADVTTIQNAKSKIKNDTSNFKISALSKLEKSIPHGKVAREIEFTKEELSEVKQLSLLTAKQILVVLNSDEADLRKSDEIEMEFAKDSGLNQDQIIVVNAKLEEELAGLSEEDQRSYLADIGIEKSGLERVIQKAFATLGLITFLTAGAKEVRAWVIRKGINAQNAAGVIHTDFMNKFIKADVVGFDDFVSGSGPPAASERLAVAGGWKVCRELGMVKSEGKEYIVHDGDVIEFKIGA